MNEMNTDVVFLEQVLREMFGTIDRAMLTAGTTESDLQVGKIPFDEPFHMMIDERINRLQEGQYLTVVLQEINDRLIQSRHLLVLLVLAGIMSRAAVEDITAPVTGFIYRKTFLK